MILSLSTKAQKHPNLGIGNCESSRGHEMCRNSALELPDSRSTGSVSWHIAWLNAKTSTYRVLRGSLCSRSSLCAVMSQFQ